MTEPTRKRSGCWYLMWVSAGGLALLVGCSVWVALTTPSGVDVRSRSQLGCKSLETAIEAYTQHEANTKHEFPTTLNDLVHPPFGGPSFLRNGETDLRDQWGKPYQMERARWPDGEEYILVTTTAPDGTPISQFGIGKNSRPKP